MMAKAEVLIQRLLNPTGTIPYDFVQLVKIQISKY